MGSFACLCITISQINLTYFLISAKMNLEDDLSSKLFESKYKRVYHPKTSKPNFSQVFSLQLKRDFVSYFST